LLKYTNLRRFEELPRYQIDKHTSELWELKLVKARIQTNKGTQIVVDIEIDLEVNEGRVKTAAYRYVASNLEGRWLIRYDSPHENALEPDSSISYQYHHRHDATGPVSFVSVLPNDAWPQVEDFLEEVVQRF
jgi:hypothetical protein